jgi:hypothetical protein
VVRSRRSKEAGDDEAKRRKREEAVRRLARREAETRKGKVGGLGERKPSKQAERRLEDRKTR